MTPTNPALHAAILANPGDDLPRLVYADWLEENGEPDRAEFIRVQCELARLRGDLRSGTPALTVVEHERATADLRRRERELWELLWESLTAPFERCAPKNVIPLIDKRTPGRFDYGRGAMVLDFRRGFLGTVRCSWTAWHGGECDYCKGRGESMPGSGSGCYYCSGIGRTPGIARSLIWWPGATDVCPECKGETIGACSFDGGKTTVYPKCPHCTAGSVPRPFPPHAQPVTRVVLTKWPDPLPEHPVDAWSTGQGHYNSLLLYTLAAEFGPHVEWVTPQ